MVGFRFSDGLDIKARNDLIERFIEHAIEGNGLQFGGGGVAAEWDGVVVLDEPKGTVSKYHREAVEKWLVQEPQILEYYVSSKIDAWYGDFEHVETPWVKKQG